MSSSGTSGTLLSAACALPFGAALAGAAENAATAARNTAIVRAGAQHVFDSSQDRRTPRSLITPPADSVADLSTGRLRL
jgi:hypothetical protein